MLVGIDGLRCDREGVKETNDPPPSSPGFIQDEKMRRVRNLSESQIYGDVQYDYIYWYFTKNSWKYIIYNLSYHRGIKKAPAEVKDDDIEVNTIFMKKYMKAKEEENTFNIVDNVIYMLNFKQFEKHTLPKWSIVHKIIDKHVHSYKLDNGKFYKYYEL